MCTTQSSPVVVIAVLEPTLTDTCKSMQTSRKRELIHGDQCGLSLLRHTASPPLASSTPSEQRKVVAIGGGTSITAEWGQAAEAASPGTAPV